MYDPKRLKATEQQGLIRMNATVIMLREAARDVQDSVQDQAGPRGEGDPHGAEAPTGGAEEIWRQRMRVHNG